MAAGFKVSSLVYKNKFRLAHLFLLHTISYLSLKFSLYVSWITRVYIRLSKRDLDWKKFVVFFMIFKASFYMGFAQWILSIALVNGRY